MWGMAIVFLIVIIIRYSIRAYQQNAVLNEILKLEQETKAKLAAKRIAVNEKTDESKSCVEKTDVVQRQTSQEKEEEDYDEYSTGHNVTKILTAPSSRKFHLSPEQIERGNQVNKELMEKIAKRKLHTE